MSSIWIPLFLIWEIFCVWTENIEEYFFGQSGCHRLFLLFFDFSMNMEKTSKTNFQPDLQNVDLADAVSPYLHFVDMGIFMKKSVKKSVIE